LAIDGVYNNYKDGPGFTQDVADAVSFGFDAKALIHPTQIEPTHLAFSPTLEEIEWAQKVASSFVDNGLNVIGAETGMLERLHLARAETILIRAKQAAER
jgi:citrate lyase subunit beta / citryl-CoA lyase